jgi:hypothetical protein
MEMKFRQTIYIFQSIIPSRKYQSFTYIELTWNEANLLRFNREEIVKIEGVFYRYSRKIFNDSTEKLKSFIKFKNHNKVIKTIEM